MASSNKVKEFEWSQYQKAIFYEIKNGDGNLVVKALAGSAKTSSLIEATNHLPDNKKILLCAFNKRIKEELDSRISNTNVKCQTLHSLGFSAIKKVHPTVEVNSRKMDDVINSLKFNIPEDSYSKIMQSLKKASSLSKANLIDTPTKIKDIVIDHDIDYTPFSLDEFVKMVFISMEKSKSIKKVIDFDDMVLHPIIFDYPIETFDYVFIDECQDLTACLLANAFKTCKKTTRIFVFLDPLQAIYQFMGAGGDQVLLNIEKLKAKELELPICYRCPKKVIDLAKEFAPNIQASPNAIDGNIFNILPNEVFTKVKPGDFLLSRYNAPLVSYALNLIKLNIPAKIAGRDIAVSLLAVIKATKAKNIETFLSKIEKMREIEIDKASKAKRSTDNIVDKFECLEVLASSCKNVKELSDKINFLFIDDATNKVVLLSSVHKIKGLEAKNVFMIKSTFSFNDQSEKNIYYTAITRAKENLYFIEKDPNKSKSKK